MSGNGSTGVKLEDVQCRLCMKVIEDPRALFCMHTFCAVCLVSSATSSRDMVCAVCGLSTPLFAGIDGLAKDLDMRIRIASYASSALQPKRKPPPLPFREPSSSSSLSSSTSSSTPAPTASSAPSSSTSAPASSSSTAAPVVVPSHLGSMWKALKGERRYPVNDSPGSGEG